MPGPTSVALRVSILWIGSAVLWQPLEAHQPHDPINVIAASPNYAQDQTLFVATNAVTMPLPVSEFLPLMSTNGGFTFTVLPGLPNQPMHSIAISPGYATDGTVFMAGQGGLWLSANRGGSWTKVGGSPLATGVQAVALPPDFTAHGVGFAMTRSNLFTTTDHGNTWQQVTAPGPLTSTLSVLGVSSNFAADSTLAAGSAADGIFLSTNGGQTWTPVTGSLGLPQVTSLVFSPAYATDRTIFAGTLGKGIYVSKNGGTGWTPANNGITDLNVTSLALAPAFAGDNLLWASTAAAGVFLSHSRGASWAPTGTVPRPLSPQTTSHFVTLAAAKGASAPALFVGMFEGLWGSTNGGSTWTYCDTIPTRLVRAMTVSPHYDLQPGDETVFVSTYGGGTLWSYDGAQTWAFQNTGLTDSYTDAIAMAPDYPTDPMAWVGTSQGLERISAGSTTWQMMTMCGGSETFPRSLGTSSGFASDSTIFIGTHAGSVYSKYVFCQGIKYPNRGLFTSVNAGQNWEGTGLQNIAVDSIGMSPNYPTDHTLFAGSSLSGLYKSTDSGANFTPITVVQGDNGTLPVTCSPGYATDQTVFAGTSHSGIYKSTDGGAHWTQLPGTSLLTAFSFALSPGYATDQTLFIGTLQQGLMKSTDGGQTLLPVAAVAGVFASAVAISPDYTNDHTVYVASYLGIYKSTDGGATWTYTAEPARQEEQREFGPGGFFSILYTGTWNITPDATASSIQLATTTQSGATASLTFLGSGASWVAQKGPTAGSAQVLLDGAVDQTVDLRASGVAEQQAVWTKRGLPCGPHTVTINATPGSGQSVTLDAIDVWQDTCAWASGGAASPRPVSQNASIPNGGK